MTFEEYLLDYSIEKRRGGDYIEKDRYGMSRVDPRKILVLKTLYKKQVKK